MKSSLVMLASLLLLALAQPSYAGPVEDVAAIAANRINTFEQGNLDGYTEAFADNATATTAMQGFRIEGKQAIRQYFADVFQQYPKRKFSARQVTARSFNDDTIIQNFYGMLSVTDLQGASRTMPVRLTVVWGKLNGRWQIVQQHGSQAPGDF